MARFGFLINYLQPASIGCRPFLRLADAEQPPSRAVAFAAGLPVEIDLHRVIGGGGYLEPVLADVQFGTAVAALAGVAPGAQHGRHRDGPAAPHELARESGLPDRHARGVVRLRDGLDGFTDESLGHGHCPAHSAKSGVIGLKFSTSAAWTGKDRMKPNSMGKNRFMRMMISPKNNKARGNGNRHYYISVTPERTLWAK